VAKKATARAGFPDSVKGPDTNHGIQIRPHIKADNQGAIALAENPVFHGKTKHIETQYHYVRERVAEGSIQIDYVPTEQMTADGLTRALPRVKFAQFVKQLILRESSGRRT
jgi:hypothetical protein